MLRAYLCLALLSPVALAAQEPARLRLADLERLALAHNPSIAHAAAGVRAAQGRTKQAGLYPNPVLGASGDDLSADPAIRGGKLGGFIEQRVVLGGKLGLSGRVAAQEEAEAGEMEKLEQLRLLTSVRILYYEALGADRLLEVRRKMADLAAKTAKISGELNNIGQADKPDRLAAEVEAQRMALMVTEAENGRDRTWRELAAVVNDPSLKPGPLDGDLAAIPKIEMEPALARILAESPELRGSQIESERAGLAVKRANAEKIPDMMLRGGVRENRELVESVPGGSLYPAGREGFFDIGVEIPIFNRNQGAVAAAKADAERARLDVEQRKIALKRRLAAVYKEYRDAVDGADRYKNEMIPKATEAEQMYVESFREMAVAYPQVLMAERNLVELQEGYVAMLVAAWRSAEEIDGMLADGESGMADGRP